MKKGQIYLVTDSDGKFWMLGRCINPTRTNDLTRGEACFIESEGNFHKEAGWCFNSQNRSYREADWKEIQWFEECERQGKFIKKEHIKFNIYEIY